jgi:sporulation integral membrane protein YlbJ
MACHLEHLRICEIFTLNYFHVPPYKIYDVTAVKIHALTHTRHILEAGGMSMPAKTLSRPKNKVAKSRIKVLLVAFICLFFMLLLILTPGPALAGARNGLTICGNTVIPSLFPFLVLSGFIIKSGLADRIGRLLEPATRHIFRLPGSAATALILGAVGGYPVGANAVSQLCKSGSLSKRDGERLLCFCINSSPAFIIGAVGAGLLGSANAGIILCVAHLTASLAIGLVMRVGAPKKTVYLPTVPQRRKADEGLTSAFVASVTGSIGSILTIAAFVVLFSSLNALLSSIGFTSFLAGLAGRLLPTPISDPSFYSRVVTGILEVTNGCAAAAGSTGMVSLILIAVMLGWSGLSVQFQVISMVKDSGISTRPFILTRLLHMVFSALFTWALFSAFPSAIPVFSPAVQVFDFNPSGISATVHPVPAVCAMLFICAMLLLSVAQV